MALDIETILSVGAVVFCYLLWWAALTVLRRQQFTGQAGGRYDNHKPWVAKAALEGLARRASACADNHAEGFPFFAVAVLFNVALRGPMGGNGVVAGLSVAVAVLRLVHLIAYMRDAASLRSLAFVAIALCIFGLYGMIFAV